MSVHSFDVIKKLSEQNCRNLKSFPLDNITDLNTGKDDWGRITIAVDNETINKLMLGNKLMGMFFVVDKEDFNRVKVEMESL